MRSITKILIAICILGLTFAACTSKKDKAPEDDKDWYIDPRESTTMQRTMTDTLAVLYNVKQYLNYQINNELDSALNMLYTPNGDDVTPLSDEEKMKIRRTMEMFPVREYKIDRMNLFNESASEVHYTIQYGSDDALSTMKCVIVPVRVGYYWYLTIPDANYQLRPGAVGE